jgi:hypothetical protein
VEDVNQARDLYSAGLEYLSALVRQGKVISVGMVEFARLFRERMAIGRPDRCHWVDALRRRGREIWWEMTADYRVAVDLNAGASIVDLRPWTGRCDTNLGPDGAAIWNGNYPFLVSSELRGGQSVCGQFCQVEMGGHRASMIDRRFQVETVTDDGFTTDAREIVLGREKVRMRSRYRFPGVDRIEVERILESSTSTGPVLVSEVFSGCVGRTEYPEDLRGIRLSLLGQSAEETGFDFNYKGRRMVRPGAGRAGAEIPSLSTKVGLEVSGAEASIAVVEGTVFDPFFRLEAQCRIRAGESLKTCLSLTGI